VEGTVPQTDTGTADAQAGGTYEPYSKALYDRSRAEGVPIILYFYANWCPICKAEEPEFRRLVEETSFGVRAIRVNYNDSDTDADEKALAKQFGITYQHTFVYIDREGNEISRTIGARSESQYRSDIDALR
jgi:thiol-disulfide isomerase/thioredoxin